MLIIWNYDLQIADLNGSDYPESYGYNKWLTASHNSAIDCVPGGRPRDDIRKSA